MKITETEILLAKPELRALLDFASRDDSDVERYGVQFEAKRGRAFAHATNTQRSVTCEGESLPGVQGRWFIRRRLLSACAKLASGSNTIRLSPATHTPFVAATIATPDPEPQALHTLTAADGCLTQLELPDVARETKPPKGAELVTAVGLPAAAMASLAIVGKAVGPNAAVSCYASDNEDAPSIFQVGTGATKWTVAIMPWKTQPGPTQKRQRAKQAELSLDGPTKPAKAIDPTELAEARRARSKARAKRERGKRGTKH